jgi:hypothetical protein
MEHENEWNRWWPCVLGIWWISVSQVSFGASVEGKLHEGYVFGQDYTFQVAVSKVEVPTDPCTNHRLLNDENAERIYGWIRSTNIVRAQISPMIRHIRSACVDIERRQWMLELWQQRNMTRCFQNGKHKWCCTMSRSCMWSYPARYVYMWILFGVIYKCGFWN